MSASADARLLTLAAIVLAVVAGLAWIFMDPSTLDSGASDMWRVADPVEAPVVHPPHPPEGNAADEALPSRTVLAPLPTESEERLVASRDSDGRALGHVAIAACPTGGSLPKSLGRTDESGSLRIPVTTTGSLVASKAGWQSSEVFLRDSCPDPIVVRLKPAAKLTGRVLSDNGPSAETVIVAWPKDMQVAAHDLAARAIRGDVRVPHAISDEQGRFSIEGVAPGVDYQVTAGKQGWIVPIPWAGDASDEITLHLSPLCAAVLEFVEEDNSPIRLHRDARIAPSGIEYYGGATLFQGPKFALVLAGIPADFVRYSSLPMLFAGTLASEPLAQGDQGTALGYCRLSRIEIPGYENIRFDVPLFSMVNGLQVVQVPLTPKYSARGAIQFQFKDAAAASTVFRTGAQDLGSIQVNGPEEYAIRVMVRDFSSPITLENCPEGIHEVSFELSGGIFMQPGRDEPPLHVTVGDTLTTVDFDLGNVRGFELFVEGPLGPYSGPVTAYLTPGRTGEGVTHTLWLAGPPYQVFGIESGSYSLRFLHPANVDLPGGGLALPFEVGQDAISRIEVRLQ